MKSSDIACPFCATVRESTPLPLRLARGSRQSVLLAMALNACGGVVEPPPEKDSGVEQPPMDAGTKPSFDAFVPMPRDASEEVMLPPPIYGGAPPPPNDD